MPCHRAKGTLDNFFWPSGLHQVGALKKPPGSTWVHLGRPGRERATDIDIHLVNARWILGRLPVLAAEKEVPPGQAEAFATPFPNLV